MKENVIEVCNLSKAYRMYSKKSDMMREALSISRKKYHNLYYALNDISFQIQKGDMVGIIGENGAGKSTLLKLLTGVITPSRGVLSVKGKIAALLELGAGFNPDYTGRQNIYLNGTMMGFTNAEMNKKVDGIIEFADIGEFIDQPVKNYSSGMFARLAFAVAINVEPDILIVDEALSVGDIFFQNKCFRKIEALKERGVTILYVSHDLASIKEMCDKVLWLENGSFKMFGDCIEICNEYSNALLKSKDKIYESTIQKESKDLYSMDEVELSDLPEITFSSDSIVTPEAGIISCFLTDQNGKIKSEFSQGEKCCLSVIIDSTIDIPNAIVGFTIATAKGMWVVNANTLIDGCKRHISINKGSKVKVDFHFDVPNLMAGEYVFEVALNDGEMANYKTYSWLYNVLRMEVENEQKQYALLNVLTDIKVSKIKLKEISHGSV